MDKDLKSLGPWPGGVNTRAEDNDIPEGFLRDSLNWIITKNGMLMRRPGMASAGAGNFHSGFTASDASYLVKDGDLCLVTKQGSALSYTVLVSGVGTEPVFYVELGGGVFWSTRTRNGLIKNGINYAWCPPIPTSPGLAVAVTGSLAAGTYLVSLTYVDALGREGGASYPEPVTLTAGQGITVTYPVWPSGVSFARVYVSGADGTELFRQATVATGASSSLISVSGEDGQMLETLGMVPMPPAQCIALSGGAIYGGIGDRLVWSEPLRPHLAKPGSRLRLLGGDVQMIGAFDGGLIVATQNSHRRLMGSVRGNLTNQLLFAYGAPLGRPEPHPVTDGFFWVSDRGYCYAGPDGSVRNLTEASVAFSNNISEAAIAYNKYNGVEQLIGTHRVGVASDLSAQDYFDAEIIRAGA